MMKPIFIFVFLFLVLFQPAAQARTPLYEEAIRDTDRMLFIPEDLKEHVYHDSSVPLQDDGRIPSPSELALVLRNVSAYENAKVLIIANNGGWCASVFSKLFKEIYLIETSRNEENYQEIFENQGIDNITAYYGSNYAFFSDKGPFDIIFIQGGITTLTNLFIDQLRSKGELFAPIQTQENFQQLIKYRKTNGNVTISAIGNTFFRVLY